MNAIAEAMNIGFWGLSSTGKTALAASVTELADFCPMLLASCDKGNETIAPLIQSGRIIPTRFTRYAEVRAIAAEVKNGVLTGKVDRSVAAGRLHSWAPSGEPYKAFMVDALSTLNTLEISARGLTEVEPGKIAGILKNPWRAMLADLRELAELGVTVVQVCHAAHRGTGVKEGITQRPAPDLYPSMQEPWKSSLDFQWMIERRASETAEQALDWVNAIFQVYMQPLHQVGVPHHVAEIKTRSVAFARFMGATRQVRPGHKQGSLGEMITIARTLDRMVAKHVKAGKMYNAAIDAAIAEINAPKK